VLVAGFGAMWYRLGRVEGRLESIGYRLDKVEDRLETIENSLNQELRGNKS